MNSQTPSPLETRLQRLDQELAITPVKNLDEIFVKRGDYRIRCTVFRIHNGFRATAKIAGQNFIYNGSTPSGAFNDLLRCIKWTINTMEFHKQVAEDKARRSEVSI